MNASMFTAAASVGDVIYARTETAEYYLLITSSQVADVYRKGNSESHATLLSKRRLGAQIAEYDGFTMYDTDGQPVAAIIPHEIKKVPRESIPLRR